MQTESTLQHIAMSVFYIATIAAMPSCWELKLTVIKVPVFEFNVEGNHVMRRRADDWINATHILKVADFDKPARTRILEREVQKSVHEKVQGGYGKYQGKSASSCSPVPHLIHHTRHMGTLA